MMSKSGDEQVAAVGVGVVVVEKQEFKKTHSCG